MTKLSISLAAAMLSVTFTPAHAYSFDPAPPTVTKAAVSTPQVAPDAGVCAVQMTPLLADILALPDHGQWQGTQTQTALACAEQ